MNREDDKQRSAFNAILEEGEADSTEFSALDGDAALDSASGDIDISGVIEVLLFASGDAVPIKKMADVIGVGVQDVRPALKALMQSYGAKGGLEIIQEEGGYRLSTKRSYSIYIDRFFGTQRRRGLSAAALEVLAIVALRQPVTKAEIEEMRGVSSDAPVQLLIRKELIYKSGHTEKIGSPAHYSTTPKFLEVFELNSLDELPTLDDFILL